MIHWNNFLSYLSGVDCALKIREHESSLNIPPVKICGIVPGYMDKDEQ